ARPAAGTAAVDRHRQYPEGRGRLLRPADQGLVVEAADPFAGPAAPDGDGAGQGADRTQPARNRRRLCRPRPHHGAARLSPGEAPAGDGRQVAGGLGKAHPQAQRVTGVAGGVQWTVWGEAVDKPGREPGRRKLSTACKPLPPAPAHSQTSVKMVIKSIS